MSHNEGREVLNMAPIDGGDKHYIRKEYTEVSQLDADTIGEENASEWKKRISSNGGLSA